MQFRSVDEGRRYCWQWLRSRPLAITVQHLTFDIHTLELIAEQSALLKKPRKAPLTGARARNEGKYGTHKTV
jgi:hypothetical protein